VYHSVETCKVAEGSVRVWLIRRTLGNNEVHVRNRWDREYAGLAVRDCEFELVVD